jgi:hypothetical protein
MEVHDDGGGKALPFTLLNINHVEVDVEGLTDFRNLLDRELETNLRPAATGIQADHMLGVGFGRANPSTQMRAAQEKYRQVLQDSVETLAKYVAVSENLIEAITSISTRYRDADLTASALATELNAAIDAARTAFQEQAEPQSQETQRELNRLGIEQA